MDPLMEAAQAGNINGLYEAIRNHPNVLKEIDETQFVDTPLHKAASAGQTDFALEMMNLKPSFGRKLNPEGLSPLDLAVRANHYDTVKRLVSFDGELVRVKGKERLTPLHRAAESDKNIGCLVALLIACPASTEDLTIRNETALHIAMKSYSAEAFKILYEWVRRAGDKQLLQKKDAEGNSAETYHKKQQPKDGKSLHVKAEKPSSLDGADNDTKKLYHYLHTPELCYESKVRKCLQFALWTQRDLTLNMRNVVLVVATLIATASFQTIFSLVTSKKDDSDETTEDLIRLEGVENSFSGWFYFLNTIAFSASVAAIMKVLQVKSYSWVLHLSLIFMVGCYWYALREIIRLLGHFVVYSYYIGSSVYILYIYYLKALFWTIEHRRFGFLAILLFSCCLEEKFRCLNQMGALTLK